MIPSFYTLRSYDVVDSTNALAKQAAEAGEAQGLVIQANSQTDGRGRQKRQWISPEGNLYLSVLLRPDFSPQQAGYFSFAAAMAVFDAISEVHKDLALSLKWPNDVLIDDAKVSGILLEISSPDPDKIDWIVIGVGINVRSAPAGQVLYPVTSLEAQGYQGSVEQVRDAFLHYLHHWYLTLVHDGFGPVRRAWLSDAHRGPLSIRFPDCEINGNFAGLDADGGLILRLQDGTEKVVHAGDVFLL